MKPQLKATRAARELIKAFEPFESDAVQRGRKWVVGFGHRAAAKPGVSVSREEAELLLIYDVAQAENAVKAIVSEDLPPAARDALISFAASVGPAAFKISDIARHARSGRHEQVGEALLQWNRVEQDGRLVVSERLITRREAERTLYLEGVEGRALAEIEPVPDEPRLGTLVDVDIEFEDPEAADLEPADPVEAVATKQAAPVDETPEAELAPEPAPEPEPEPEPELEAEPVPVEEATIEEVEAEAVEADATDELEAEPVDQRAQQDAAVQAVMARMASEIATRVPVQPEEDDVSDAEDEGPSLEQNPEQGPEQDDEEVGAGVRRLGYSYLVPHPVTAPTEEAAEPAPTETNTPTSEAAGAGTGPVYATVSVGSVAASTGFAPPHPAEAPARAQGLSGEVEGPDHPDTDEGEYTHDEDDDLDPALVAGPEAQSHGDQRDEAMSAPERGGHWVYTANLGVGALMTALGGFWVWTDLEYYLAVGPGYDWLPVGALAAGVLLTAASAWFLIGARNGSAKR